MIKVYDDEPTKSALEKAKLPNGIYVNVNLREVDISNISFSRSGLATLAEQARKGLNIALVELRKAGDVPIILYSYERTTSLFSDIRFAKLMVNENVYFIRDIFVINKINDYLNLPTFKNEALEIAVKNKDDLNLLNILRTNYPKDPKKNIVRARVELDLDLSDEEIGNLLKYYDRDLPQRNIGKVKGVFCGVEDTLWRNGQIDKKILEILVSYSEKYPVNLWTDKNVVNTIDEIGSEFESQVEYYNHNNGIKTNLHLRTPILNRDIFIGSRPEIVLDHLTLEEFRKQFDINPERYERV